MMSKVPNAHPGEILLEEFLKPMGIAQYRLAKELDVPQRRIGEFVAGKRSITADTGLRFQSFSDSPKASGSAFNWTMTRLMRRILCRKSLPKSRRGNPTWQLRQREP